MRWSLKSLVIAALGCPLLIIHRSCISERKDDRVNTIKWIWVWGMSCVSILTFRGISYILNQMGPNLTINLFSCQTLSYLGIILHHLPLDARNWILSFSEKKNKRLEEWDGWEWFSHFKNFKEKHQPRLHQNYCREKNLRFGVLGGRRESIKDLKKPFFSPQNAHVVEMQFVVFLYTPELTTTARPWEGGDARRAKKKKGGGAAF